MEKIFFIILLLTGVIPLVFSVRHKYYLIQQLNTWSNAKAYCQTNHVNLAKIESVEDMLRLQTEAEKQHFNSSAWVGLYNNVNSWRWSFKNETLGSVRLWTTGEPNNIGGNQECGGILPTGWVDADCFRPSQFVCFDDRNTGSNMYIRYANLKTWYDAQSYCRQYHTDLASSRDSNENSIITGKIVGQTWFGLFRDSWTWSDETKALNISWGPTQPDNYFGKEDCAYINNSQTYDSLCTRLLPFFCHRDITGHKQFLRIKLQSVLDVTDPSVQASVLEKIKEKLKGHGMSEDITVKFRTY